MKLLVALALCVVCVAAAENSLPRHKRGWETTTQGWGGWTTGWTTPPPPPPPPTSGWGWPKPTEPPYSGWGSPPGWGSSSNYQTSYNYPNYGYRPRPYGRRYSRYSDFAAARSPDRRYLV